MGHALLWVESLAAALATVGLVTACAAHRSRRWNQRLLPFLFSLGVMVLAGGVSVALAWSYSAGIYGRYQLGYASSWTLCFVVGAIMILKRGLQREGVDSPRAARFWPRGWLAAGMAVAAALAVITLTNLDLALKIELAGIRAEGSVRVVTLLPPPISDSENAALIYRQVFQEFNPDGRRDLRSREWIHSRKKIDPEDKELAHYLESKASLLALVRRAAGMPGCRFERDYLTPLRVNTSNEVTYLLEACAHLVLDARYHASRKESRAAFEDVAALFGMARQLNEPTLLFLLTSIAIENYAIQTLQEVLAQTTPTATDLAVLPLQDISFQKRYRRTLQMEEAMLFPLHLLAAFESQRANGIWQFGLQQPEMIRDLVVQFLCSPLYRVFFLSDDLAAYREHMRTTVNLADQKYWEVRGDWEKTLTNVRAGMWAKISHGLEARYIPGMVQADASHRLAQLALAAEGYRVANGKLADQLDELVPIYISAIPTDPFSGKPLRAKRDGKTLILYSVGPSGLDDGGKGTGSQPVNLIKPQETPPSFHLTDR